MKGFEELIQDEPGCSKYHPDLPVPGRPHVDRFGGRGEKIGADLVLQRLGQRGVVFTRLMLRMLSMEVNSSMIRRAVSSPATAFSAIEATESLPSSVLPGARR